MQTHYAKVCICRKKTYMTRPTCLTNATQLLKPVSNYPAVHCCISQNVCSNIVKIHLTWQSVKNIMQAIVCYEELQGFGSGVKFSSSSICIYEEQNYRWTLLICHQKLWQNHKVTVIVQEMVWPEGSSQLSKLVSNWSHSTESVTKRGK